MMNKELERLITSIQALKQIFEDLGLNANAEIEYKDGSKETINVYETIEKQIVKDINSYDSQLTVEEIDYILSFPNEINIFKRASICMKLKKQKEILTNENTN